MKFLRCFDAYLVCPVSKRKPNAWAKWYCSTRNGFDIIKRVKMEYTLLVGRISDFLAVFVFVLRCYSSLTVINTIISEI